MVIIENWDEVTKWLLGSNEDPDWSHVVVVERNEGGETQCGRFDRPKTTDEGAPMFLDAVVESWAKEKIMDNALGAGRTIFRIRFYMPKNGATSRMGSKSVIAYDDADLHRDQTPAQAEARAEVRGINAIIKGVEHLFEINRKFQASLVDSVKEWGGMMGTEARAARQSESQAHSQIAAMRREDDNDRATRHLAEQQMKLQAETVDKGIDHLSRIMELLMAPNGAAAIPAELRPLADAVRADPALATALTEMVKDKQVMAMLKDADARRAVTEVLRAQFVPTTPEGGNVDSKPAAEDKPPEVITL